jgi:hypothetical protein
VALMRSVRGPFGPDRIDQPLRFCGVAVLEVPVREVCASIRGAGPGIGHRLGESIARCLVVSSQV